MHKAQLQISKNLCKWSSETEFDTATYPAQDFNFKINSNNKSIVIGRYMGSDNYYDGVISHIIYRWNSICCINIWFNR